MAMVIFKKVRIISLFFLSIVLFASSTVNAIYAMSVIGVTNHFETGIIDIRLEEYQLDEMGREVSWQNKENILPGDNFSKIPRIYNDGNDCYIRAEIAIRGGDEVDVTDLSGIQIHGISEDWTLADDGYYYYKNELLHGKSVDLFQSVHIPEEFPDCLMGKSFYIDINVDSIQSKNFTPNFDLAMPWGSVEILECEKKGQYDISSFKQSASHTFSIIYQGEIKQLIKNADDFFSNFPYLMPGDCYSDTVSLVNNSGKEITLYFRSEGIDNSDLLDKIQLKITTTIHGETKVFYEGSLRAESISENVVLGVIPKNATGEFLFEIEVPAELNNQYTILNSYVKWIFSADENETDEPNVPEEPSSSDDESEESTNPDDESESPTNPDNELEEPTNPDEEPDDELEDGNAAATGDTAYIKLIVSLCGMLIGLLLFIWCVKTSQNEGGASYVN